MNRNKNFSFQSTVCQMDENTSGVDWPVTGAMGHKHVKK